MSIIKVGPPRRRIMREFKLAEISSVDVPAQEGATAVIIKAAPAPTAKGVGPEIPPAPAEPLARPNYHAETFQDAVGTIRRLEKVSGVEAMRIARRRHPDLLARMQKEGREATLTKTAPAFLIPPAMIAFEKRIDEVMREGIKKRTEAMVIARQRFPKEFEAVRSL